MLDPKQVDITEEVKSDDKEIDHKVTNFVDDSNSVISSKNEDKLKEYLEKYTMIMKIFYSANFLKMNQSKTNIMIIPKRSSEKEWLKETIKTDYEPLKTSATTNILGSVMNNGLTNENEINKLHSQLQNILNCLKTLGKCSTMKIRLQLANTAFMGRLNYMLPTYTNLTTIQYSKIHAVMMRMAKWTKGEYVPRERNSTILKALNWLPLKQMIVISDK